ncbi:NUDIX hydrolase [Actinoplanes bogorensis]|uniref:NUDIX hydrolase n=1 Tax=Paractinoplanes bogorensis TaxID=1610840 RepID=A0ABS5YY00_9ACTN|nr:NUDIX domain-containing protein [Actinoplanes bogorensis]MBU2668206.1 NUDIX hydrolase [Actinoplanes bogorensis]
MKTRDHAQLEIAADLVVLTVREAALQVLVITRGKKPFLGRHALPGGFVREGEDIDDAAARELKEETGLDRIDLEQFAVYGKPERDPRGRVVSVSYLAIMPDLPLPTAGSDASGAGWVAVDKVRGSLAFDHDRILDDAVERARRRLELTTVATKFCPDEFTIGDLRSVYEIVWGETLDPRNFSRKVINTDGFVEPTGGKRMPATGRPAALYRAGAATTLNPPILRTA